MCYQQRVHLLRGRRDRHAAIKPCQYNYKASILCASFKFWHWNMVANNILSCKCNQHQRLWLSLRNRWQLHILYGRHRRTRRHKSKLLRPYFKQRHKFMDLHNKHASKQQRGGCLLGERRIRLLLSKPCKQLQYGILLCTTFKLRYWNVEFHK
jgi:hypothetical protein